MDMLVVFGRGVEQVPTVRGYVWKPTRYIERLDNRSWHSRFRVSGITPDDSDPHVVTAGANANVIAAAHLFCKLQQEGRAPHVVAFAAGRPGYLANEADPTFSEGQVLKERFLRLVDIGKSEITIQTHNKNTRDDLLESLHFAQGQEYACITIIAVGVHLLRIKEFLRRALVEDSSLETMKVEFRASEEVLFERSDRYRRLLLPIRSTRAYERTAAMEAKGLADLRAGTYDFDSEGSGFPNRKS
jgi:hypothetical protein